MKIIYPGAVVAHFMLKSTILAIELFLNIVGSPIAKQFIKLMYQIMSKIGQDSMLMHRL